MKRTRPPHDALFKAAFSDPRSLRAELEALLPPDVVEGLDLSSAKLMPGSFVDNELRSRHTDLLWSVRFHDREAFLFLLLEHKSWPDPLTAFQLLRYMVRIWDRWLSRNTRARNLPAVIPLVVFQGPGSWKVSRHFSELFELPAEALAALEKYLPSFEILIDELAECSDTELRRRSAPAQGKVTLLLLKSARESSDLLALLASMADLLGELDADSEGLETVLRYTLLVGDFSVERLRNLLESRVGPRAAEAAMTTGERLQQEGIEIGLERGREEGLEEGIEKGMEKGRRDLFMRQVRLRFGELSLSRMERIRQTSGPDIDRCAERILTAASFDDLFDE